MCHPESWGSTRKGLQMQRQRSESQIRQKGSGCTRLRTWSHCCQTRWVYFKGLKRSRNYAKYLNNRVYRCGLRRRGDSFAYRTATAWGCRVCRWMLGERSQGVSPGRLGAEKRQCEIAACKPQSFRSPLVFILFFIVPASHGLFWFQKHFIAHRQAGSHPESTIDACLWPKLTACVAFDDTN